MRRFNFEIEATPHTTPPPGMASSDPADPQDFDDEEYVVNRQGQREPVSFGKIGDRISQLMSATYGKRLRKVNRVKIERQVIGRFISGMTTLEIDNMIVEVCQAMIPKHPQYSILAARFVVSNLQKSITHSFAEVYEHLDRGPKKSRISPAVLTIARRYESEIEARIDQRRDFDNDAFGIATIMRSYCLRDPETGEVAETPQHMYMRMAITLRCLVRGSEGVEGGTPIEDETVLQYALEEAFNVYDYISTKRISHASPTATSSGTILLQLSSCFQVEVDDDFGSLMSVLADIGMMSKTGGGISVCLSRMRAKGALIRSSGGRSVGVEGYIRLLNQEQDYANQGGLRKGAFACYLHIWHADVFTFLEMGLPKGPRFEQRKDGRLLKYALMIPDRFMRALIEEIDVSERLRAGEEVPAEEVAAAGNWYLMSPDESPDLTEVYDERSINHDDGPGGAFSLRYDKYIAEGRYREVVKASAIVKEIIRAISLTGNPYMLLADHINRQSNLTTESTV
ncbi:MAG: ribonucleoside-diphosphate reductase subunit alpha, partial [Gemmatimonadales bacterium]|nr:ribonucleoside-diphosphate reductase subunit alpha [Gemmatimonadales bacterium]